MAKLKIITLMALMTLPSCGSITLPAAVKMDSGEVLTGTTTAALSGGTFQVKSPNGATVCGGNYDALDTTPTISAPVTCNDGRYGTVLITRDIANNSGIGAVQLASGETGRVAFGRTASSVFIANPSPASYGIADYSSVSPSRTYTGNCPTPESIAADGKRCGKRSAAWKAGGYDGYGSWSSAQYRPSYGSTYVRGHYRKGRYVRGHYRRR